MIRFLFVIAAMLCVAALYAAEPPVIRETVEPPSIVGQCECSTGAPCICGPECSCTVPVIATLVREDSAPVVWVFSNPEDMAEWRNNNTVQNDPLLLKAFTDYDAVILNFYEDRIVANGTRPGESRATEIPGDFTKLLEGYSKVVAAPPRNPFSTDSCPDGNCARGAAPRIVGATAGVVRSVYGLSDRPRLFSGEGRPVRRLLGVVFRPFRGLRGGCCN